MVIFYFCTYITLWISLMLMILAMYRFKLSTYWKQAAIAGLILTPFSVLIHYKVYNLMGPIQVILVLLTMWYVFKISIGYATIMTLSGYLLGGIPDLSADLFYEKFMGVENVPPLPQFIIILLFQFAVTYICSRYRIGFSFVPSHKRGKPLIMNKANSNIVLALVLAFVWIIVGTLISTKEVGLSYVLLTIVIILILLAILLKQQYNKDLED